MKFNIVEAARKVAGIPSMVRDVPAKGYRGCHYWGGFVMAVRVHAGIQAEELFEAQAKINDLADEVNRLQAELAKKDRMVIKHGIDAIVREVPELTDGNREKLLRSVSQV